MTHDKSVDLGTVDVGFADPHLGSTAITANDARRYHGEPPGPDSWFGGTIVAHLADRARQHPTAPFLTVPHHGNGFLTVRYGEFDEFTRRAGHWLRTTVGVWPGEAVAMVPRTDLASIVMIVASLRIGCRLLLLSPADPPARLHHQTEALGVRTVLCAPDLDGDRHPGAVTAPDPLALPVADTTPDSVLDPAGEALYFPTSGSTAASKLVAQTHYNAVVNAQAVTAHHGLRVGDRILGCLPLHHVNGLHFTLVGTLVAGAHVLLAPGFDPFSYPRMLREFRPRIASVVPSLLEALAEVWRGRELPSLFDYFVSAAAPLTPATLRRVESVLGARVLQGYGLTETTNFSTTMPPGLPEPSYRRLGLDADIPSVGVALPGNEVAVLRPDGSRADPGETGEICMRGHNVMSQYWANPRATAEAFRGGWFHSQDLGYETVDVDTGQHLFVITGREKNIAKVDAEAVSLEEVERALCALPEVRDAACAAVPDRMHGEVVVAAVSFAGVERPDLRAQLRGTLSAAALPRRVVELDAIPRTPTGKILRPDLTARLAAELDRRPGEPHTL